MTSKYSEYLLKQREEASAEGLKYTFSQALSAIPAVIGHSLDTAFGWNGIWLSKDKSDYLAGPFGAIFGGAFWLIGMVIGFVLHYALRIPSLIGHYLLDYPLGCREMMKAPPLNTIYIAYSALTQTPPVTMQGPFGFLFGFIPQLVHYGIAIVGAALVGTLNYLSDRFSDFVELARSKLSFTKKNQNNSSPQINSSEKKPIISPPEHNIQIASNTHKVKLIKKYKKNKIDAFALLNITMEDYKKDPVIAIKQFKKLALTCHPDKNLDNNPDKREKFEKISEAKTVLEDATSLHTKDYIAAYENWQNTGNRFGMQQQTFSPTFFAAGSRYAGRWEEVTSDPRFAGTSFLYNNS